MANPDTSDVKSSSKDDIIENAPKLIKLVIANDVNGAENLLIRGEATVHDTDSTGMTGLMHAAYKGFTDMCKMLIKQGSDVNADSHSHSYYPLHFAALSSSLDTVQLLLEHGAKTYKTNSLGRTAAQMAGFVGQSSCVALINNHVDRSELRRYTHPESELQTTRLDPEAEQPLYDLMVQLNLHPVYLTLRVCKSPVLLKHLKAAAAVLDHLSVTETKRSNNVNEVLSLKFHYLGYLLKHLASKVEEANKDQSSTDFPQAAEVPPCLEGAMKQWLRCRARDGAEVVLELWVRDAVKAFHCLEMPLFLQVARNMAGQEVQALAVLSGAINGQRVFAEDRASCASCGDTKDTKHCAKCRTVQYCDKYCQKLHWSTHKKSCDKISKNLAISSEKLDKENRATQDAAK
ncbi:ankyrin repeat and MYND domain-containing protein 2 isoform X4 [Hyalella azteca]|uniref:Ankyrin repeat and MYND domain-containing protein 2 isoform X4 n=1 Tax=Hyalella azteca TaxID=294128 RepID=A0A979FID6_HYAAZ|nr:ankyrin repeat and MYND domain-containing protein 2 isoform X4 [Hyalella azteca]